MILDKQWFLDNINHPITLYFKHEFFFFLLYLYLFQTAPTMITDAGKDLIWKKVKNKILRENKGKNKKKKNMSWINTVKVKVKVAWAAAHGLNVKKDILKELRKITVADVWWDHAVLQLTDFKKKRKEWG